MPQLKEYTARVDSLQPTERGVDARLQEARVVRTQYNQAAGEISGAARAEASAAGDVASSVGNAANSVTELAKRVDDYLGQREVSKGSAASSQLFSDLTNRWNDTVKAAGKNDPNDPTVAAKFREEVMEPALQSFRDAYSNTPAGQKWSESHVEQMRQQFFRTTAADMASLAGAAVETNINTIVRADSNTASRNPDFHTVDFLLRSTAQKVNDVIDGAPNLKGVAAEKMRVQLTAQMREAIVSSGAIAALERSNDPVAAAAEWTKKFPDLLSGQAATALERNARQQVRATRTDEAYQRHNADLERKRISEGAENDILKRVYSDDPRETSKVSTREIVNDDRLSNPTKEKLIRLVEREMKPESDARISAETSRELFARIYLPDGDPRKIVDTAELTQARVDGKLTKADYKDLRDEIAQARTPEGNRLGAEVSELVKAVKPAIDKANPLMGKLDPDGGLNLYRFERDLKAKIAEYRKAGKDPRDLLDPGKPDFFAKPDALKQYQKTLSQSTTDTARRLSGGGAKPAPNLTDNPILGVETTNVPNNAPMRKPGESIDAWLKRTGTK